MKMHDNDILYRKDGKEVTFPLLIENKYNYAPLILMQKVTHTFQAYACFENVLLNANDLHLDIIFV